MAENPRIEELRRRVQKDPASIAFAQLAEEYRRAGHYEEAIEICRIGLQTHPSYLSARVTLGRALIEMNDLEHAEVELRYVLQHAAENLAAIRAMAEIHHRREELTEALGYYKSALELARHDPDLEQTVEEISRTIAKAPAPAPVAPPPEASPALTPEQATAEFLAKTFDLLELDELDLAEPTVAEPVRAEPVIAEPIVAAPVIAPEPEPEAAPEAAPEQFFQAAMEDVGWVEDVMLVEEPPRLDEEPRAAWGVGAAQASGEERGEGPPRLDEEPRAAGGVGALQASGKERGEGPPRLMIAHPALPGLERFLEAIHSYRQRRAV